MTMNSNILARWILRLIGLLAVTMQSILFLSTLADRHFPIRGRLAETAVEVLARGIVAVGFLAALRYERIGGAAMILGSVLLSMAIYSWAAPLGTYASTLIAVHCFPTLITGLLFLSMPGRIEEMQGIGVEG